MNKQLSLREKVLLLSAGVILTVVGYYFLRYRPEQKALETAKSQTKELESQSSKTQGEMLKLSSTPEVNVDLVSLKKALEQLEIDTQQQQQKLGELKLNFLPADDGELLQFLKVQIANLAKDSGVQILQSVPYERPGNMRARVPVKTKEGEQPTPLVTKVGPFVSEEFIEDLYGSRLHEFRLESSFLGLRTFLLGLNELKWNVTVVEFEVVTEKPTGNNDAQPPLKTKLIIAM